jgi:hypothetical protein
MRILVTRAPDLARSQMVAEGHDVVAIDKLVTGQVRNVPSVSRFIKGPSAGLRIWRLLYRGLGYRV